MCRRLFSILLALAAVLTAAITLPSTASAESEIVCPNQVPTGWIHTDSFYVWNVCGSGPNPPTVTQWEITRYDNLFRDDVLVVCVDASVPAGWAELGREVQFGRCGLRVGTNVPPNVKLIKCLNCPIRQNPPTPTPVTGSIDAVFPTGVVAGWARDPGAPGGSVTVHFYLDGPAGTGQFAGQTVANAFRSDVGAHAFAWTLPSGTFDDQQHSVYAYGIDLNPGETPRLLGSKTFRLPNRPIGNLESIDAGGRVSGWTLDPSLESYAVANRVRFYVDGFFVGEIVADLPRPDVNQSAGYPGDHGFRWPIPASLRDGGLHTLQALGSDRTGQADRELTGSPKTFQLTRPRAAVDVDADRSSDIGVWRPSTGTWWLQPSATGGNTAVAFGLQGDKPVPADYDGDGRMDIAVFRPAEGTWYILNSASGSVTITGFGLSADVPEPGDYDGDGHADLAVFRPSDSTWYVLPSTGGSYYGIPFGQAGDKPVAADYDGDGRMDIAVLRPNFNAWFIRSSATGAVTSRQFGAAGDRLAPADYDGDTRADIAVFRPAQGTWWIHRSLDDRDVAVSFGTQGDIPAAADYDGDGRADLTVFRPSTGTWYQQLSSTGAAVTTQFGLAGDLPLASALLPS